MADYDDLKTRAEQVRDETNVGANTAPRVGGLLVDMVEAMREADSFDTVKNAVNTILYNLGNYCFPNGRPTIDWGGGGGGGTATVTKTIGTGLSSSGGDADVNIGDSLEVTIAITDNLYVVDDDSVVVTMGGTPVVGAWDPSTMKVTIASVLADVVINVPSMTYVDGGDLVSMFDGMYVDSDNNQWVDMKDNNRSVQLTNCTVASDHVEFNGSTSEAINTDASVYVDVPFSSGTIESVSVQPAVGNGVLSFLFCNPKTANRLIILAMYGISASNTVVSFSQSLTGSDTTPIAWQFTTGTTTTHLSVSDARAYLNGAQLSRYASTFNTLASTYSRMAIKSVINSSGTHLYQTGSMYCLRIYSRQLSADEVAQNYKVDQKRFNL